MMHPFLAYIEKQRLLIFSLLLLPVFIWSAIEPKRLDAWFAEILPLMIGILLMLKTHRHYPLTPFSYVVIYLGALLMLIGSHYSYANVPLCDWVREFFGFERNNYDKIVHVAQGFLMATLMRELIIRKQSVTEKSWINFFALCYAIAFAAVWEMVEWLYVMLIHYLDITRPEYGFLGEQGYHWDAQSDIFFGALGAMIMLWLWGAYHTQQMRRLGLT